MNVLDVAENSLRAGASLIEIALVQSTETGLETLTIADDGCGMDAAMLAKVTDPFTTTRTTRKVGLGLPFLQMAARQTGGDLSIESEVGKGTTVTASFTLGHIDLAPLGDMGGSISALAAASGEAELTFRFERDGRVFSFDTREARAVLGDVPLSAPAVSVWVRQAVNEGIDEILSPAQ